MKNLNKLYILLFSLFFAVAYSQKNTNTANQINKIKSTQKNYIGKPFSLLLDDLQAKIKSYKGGSLYDSPNYIILYFENVEETKAKRRNNINPSFITVFFGTDNKSVNKNFESLNSKHQRYEKGSLDAYKNLNVIGIDSYIEK